MKEILKKVFSKKLLEPILMFIVSMLILEYVVFPGLTISNSIINIVSAVIGILLGLIVLTYSDNIIREKFEKKEDKPSQEQEKTEEDGK